MDGRVVKWLRLFGLARDDKRVGQGKRRVDIQCERVVGLAQLVDRVNHPADICQHRAVLMMLAAAIEPSGRHCALEQAFLADEIVPVEQHGLDVHGLTVAAVDGYPAVGRFTPARARLIKELFAVCGGRNLPVGAGNPQPSPMRSPERPRPPFGRGPGPCVLPPY